MGAADNATYTKIDNIIKPEIFNPYIIEQTTRVNAFFQAGIIANVPEVSLQGRGGSYVQMPFWPTLGERAQLLDDDYDLDVKKIQAKQDTAVLHARALVYGATDLAAALAGDDPMRAIANGLAENWAYEFNNVLLSTLQGAMSRCTSNTHDISALSGTAAYIDGESFIDASQKLGDFKDRISGVAMHSAVESSLAKNDLIETVRDSEGKIVLRSFMGKQVIVDDALTPVSGSIYTSYLFGPAAIGWSEGAPKVASETMRSPLTGGGQEYIVNRRHFILHPRGVRWTPAVGAPAKTVPSDAELQDADNWTQVYETKNIRVVKFVHKC